MATKEKMKHFWTYVYLNYLSYFDLRNKHPTYIRAFSGHPYICLIAICNTDYYPENADTLRQYFQKYFEILTVKTQK